MQIYIALLEGFLHERKCPHVVLFKAQVRLLKLGPNCCRFVPARKILHRRLFRDAFDARVGDVCTREGWSCVNSRVSIRPLTRLRAGRADAPSWRPRRSGTPQWGWRNPVAIMRHYYSLPEDSQGINLKRVTVVFLHTLRDETRDVESARREWKFASTVKISIVSGA